MARKIKKTTRTTPYYVVGTEMHKRLRKIYTTDKWSDHPDSTYTDNLIGYFNGIPVLRHQDSE